MRTRFLFLVVTIAVACTGLHAQADLKYCGTDDMLHQLYLEHPELREREGELRNVELAEGQRNRANNQIMSSVYIIPVVFHIVHDYGVENISDAQVMDAVSILNRDFRKLNADTSSIVAPFGPLAADCEIEFRLAQFDPNGNCTNGIDRIQSIETYVGDNGCKLNQWPRGMYLNIWVVRDIASGAAGFAYYPWTVDTSNSSRDGIVILSSYVGSIGTGNPATARALTHEVGHYLGLAHVWGSTNNPGVACGDDGIGDTPDTKGWTTCNLTSNDVCNPGQPENVQNYMEYAYCQRMFTAGQAITMQYILNSTVSDRNNLWSPGNLAATGCMNVQPLCAPHADFDANRFMVCQGSTITLYDNSWSSAATAWSWTVTGPDTFNFSTQNPLLSPLTIPGSYTVTLIASNAAGSDTLTRPNYFFVSSNAPAITQPYVESFESPYFMNLGYIINNRGNNINYFHTTTMAAYSGTTSLMLNNFGTTMRGDVDELITPAYYLDHHTGLQLQFTYAYATASLNANNNVPKLRVYSSTNCGQLWALRWAKTDSLLSTVGLDTNIFVPTQPGMWSTVTVNLPASCAAPNVRFKFEFSAPADRAGNNLYIDDINILGTNVGVQENGETTHFNVYPNPGDGSSVISYVLDKSTDVKIDLYDLSGRLVSSRNLGEQTAGTYVLPLSEIAPALAEGTYVIQMHCGDLAPGHQLFISGKTAE
jgi:PKD repeat protein